MIPNNTLDVIELAGELPGEDIDYTFNAEALDHLMGVLTDMYTDTMLAPIREYSTNARDIHIEAGVDGPIHITPPNHLSKFFVVQDFGTGLSKDDFKRIYTQYGASTKRESNDFNGSLGIGAKSAMTYTPVFNMTSVKDGIRYEAEIRRKASGGVKMKILVETKDEVSPSGVTVRIPVAADDVYEFRNKIAEFFKWWDPTTFKIIGDLDVPYVKPGLKRLGNSEKIFFNMQGTYEDDIVVMGNVAYPSPWPKMTHQRSVVYFADNGEAVFTRSREALMTVDKNKDLLDDIAEKIKGGFDAEAKALMDEPKTELEAYSALKSKVTNLCYSYYGHRNFVEDFAIWNGTNLNDWARVMNDRPGAREFFRVYAGTNPSVTHYKGYDIVDFLPHCDDIDVFIVGAPEAITTSDSSSCDVLERAIQQLGYADKKSIVFKADEVPEFFHDMLDQADVVEWSDVRKASAKFIRDSKPKAKKATSEWEHLKFVSSGYYYSSTYEIGSAVAEVEDEGEGYIYASRKEILDGDFTYGSSRSARIKSFKGLIESMADGVYEGKVLIVPGTRESTFKRRFPKAKTVSEALRPEFEAMLTETKTALTTIDSTLTGADLDLRARILLLINSGVYSNAVSASTSWTNRIKKKATESLDDERFAAYYESAGALKKHTDAAHTVFYKVRNEFGNRSMLNAFLLDGRTTDDLEVVDPYIEADILAQKIIDDYPLLAVAGGYSDASTKAYIDYINVMFAHSQK